MSECDVNPNTTHPAIPLILLKSLKYRNRMIWINGDPFLNYLLPLCNQWKPNALADEIMRACAAYDVRAEWDIAKLIAIEICKKIIQDNLQAAEDGGYQLGWD